MDANEWLTTGATPWAKFSKPGDKVEGRIMAPPSMRQSRDFDTQEPMTWPNGDPVMEVLITLDTKLRDPEIEDDDGARTFVVNSQAKRNAVREAIRKAGAHGLEVDGYLEVTYTHDGPSTRKNMAGPKQYTVAYVPPSAIPAGALDDDDTDIPF